MLKKIAMLLLCLFLVHGIFAAGQKEEQQMPKAKEGAEPTGAVKGQYEIDGQRYATQFATLADFERATGMKIQKFGEAPMLEAKVAKGQLPPVEERLPDDLVVIIPTDKIGQYGGQMRVLNTHSTWSADAQYFAGGEHFITLAPDNKTMLPNIAKEWKFSSDGKSLTMYLRRGMKWSDGETFTADDIMFWYEDVLLDKELTPKISRNWSPGETAVAIRKIDDYAVAYNFAVPYPTVKYLLAQTTFYYPKHYLKEFHVKYNPKAKELAEKAGFEAWYQIFRAKHRNRDGMPMIPDFPALSSFICTKQTPEFLSFERNPYYWKVDSAGNQLPYVDTIRSTYVQDAEMYTTKIATGQSGFAIRVTSVDNYPLYKENAEKGRYRVILWKSAGDMSQVFYQLNFHAKDPVLAKIFRDVRFRRALSVAIDRGAINKALFFGKGMPTQWTVRPASRLYEERFSKAYAEYDPGKANRWLDDMGLKWDSEKEYRLRPDGKKLSFTLEAQPGGGGMAIVVAQSEMVIKYWKDIGVDVPLKVESRELAYSRIAAGEHDMESWEGSRSSEIKLYLDPSGWMPYTLNVAQCWGPKWSRWYADSPGEKEEPPQEVKDLLDWWEKMRTTLDEEERIRLGKKIVASQAENIRAIGVVGLAPWPLIVDERLRNVPEKYDFGFDWDYTTPIRPEQFYLEQ